jgi:hypothetical protein
VSENNGKIVVDASELTLREMAELSAVAGDFEAPGSNFRFTAALAWAMKRRTDPDFTFEQALDLKMGDLDIVGEADPEVLAANIGGKPPASVEPGPSTPEK